jgi:bifunctional N-acetylglucosamine-1-phosphate-uridyltransferase/glucosamine-1-phosphate-acetyltransferase GlmU-like protein
MTDQGKLLEAIDRTRERHGFLSLAQTLALQDRGNVIFDPFSTLISRRATIGEDNVFHPNTRVDCQEGATLRIGSRNLFHSGTVIEVASNSIAIGDGNQFGEGLVCVKANAPGAAVDIGDNCRLCGVINLFGKTTLGSGSQVLGDISVYDCALAAGQPHSHPVADERGAVLKGSGSARALRLATGQVIDGWGVFRSEDALPQSSFHP